MKSGTREVPDFFIFLPTGTSDRRLTGGLRSACGTASQFAICSLQFAIL